MKTANGPGFWTTVGLLLGATRRRSHGRQRRQQELLQNRSKKSSMDWNALGIFLTTLMMIALNVVAAFVMLDAVGAGQRVEVERHGKIVVSEDFFEKVQGSRSPRDEDRAESLGELNDSGFEREAKRIEDRQGGRKDVIERRLRTVVAARGVDGLETEGDAAPGLKGLGQSGPIAWMLGSVVLLWWGVMLTFQGEGLELDLQRRRHPMWEWLFSHPVEPGAVFLAEMLGPIAGNPVYWGGPLFAGVVYGMVYGFPAGLAAVFLVGVPVTVAAACVGKALEIGVTLRVAPRSRGAIVGLMSWLGYATLMAFFLLILVLPRLVTALGRGVDLVARAPWPFLGWFVGSSFPVGVLTCWFAAVGATAVAVWFSAWGAQQGLAGNFTSDTAPARTVGNGVGWTREPLYRKEFLWFVRDRSAIVQTILVPITVAGVQAFNLRVAMEHATDAWNHLAGAAIIFGTYFLWVLGPKSLQSEGTALWIALTWPRGLESLLKAKAWLWSMISNGVVALVLGVAVALYPEAFWKIAAVGVGWFFFGRSMAEKSVTLVTVASESGEVPKTPSGRRWGAQLGMLTFAVGVVTQQWTLALVGIVYSYVTAAAMWESFRAHLPYLYDPWSEVLPHPPTLMHAMISISILVEGASLVMGVFAAFAGKDYLAMVQAASYAVSAVAVAIGVTHFLGDRGVLPHEVWCWREPHERKAESEPWWKIVGLGKTQGRQALGFGVAAGLALGMAGRGYSQMLQHLPMTSDMLRKAKEQMASIPDARWAFAVMAVGFAPWAEEYLFRGLLYRALDKEWGGWRAVVGSAAFFAIYHPPTSWIPVGLLGAANCLLFKKTRSLAPCVLLHMAYNAVVVL
jgi:membrane protease YdiL (CAAX protease family)